MNYKRVPPNPEDILLLDAPSITPEIKQKLLQFNKEYQLKGLRFFARLKLKWEKDNPGKTFPGLCAEVDSVTGRIRPLEEQRAWSWGDTRALGIWCYFLQKNRIPDAEETIDIDSDKVTVNLRDFYNDYCDHLYTCLDQRLETCDGRIPFLVDIQTNRASDDPRNLKLQKHEFSGTHIFAVNAFFQYGMLRNNKEAIDMGWKILEETFRAAHENRFANHMTGKIPFQHSHGLMMVSSGALVDTLKTIGLLETRGDSSYSDMKEKLVQAGRWAMDIFLGYHWNRNTKTFAEYLHPVYKTPYEDDRGRIICDPGHAAEGAGFFSEFHRFLPENDSTVFRYNRDNMLPVLSAILKFIDEHGYSDNGVMFKNIDLKHMQGTADVIDSGGEYRTAPWWNVRECAAAAIRMFVLTGKETIWNIYIKAFNACYQNYPNENIGGLMLQTLDADTMEPLPFHPATGNLDPMHSPRAREREIEALEEINFLSQESTKNLL